MGGAGCCCRVWLDSTLALGRLTSNEYLVGGGCVPAKRPNVDLEASGRRAIVILIAAGNIPSCVESHWISEVVPLAVESALVVPPDVVPWVDELVLEVPLLDVPVLVVPAVPP